MKIKNLGLASVLVLSFAAIAYSAGQPCDSIIPRCPTETPGVQQGCDNNTGLWEFGPIKDYTYYHCNGRDGHCANDPGNCNVMVATPVQGRTLECVPGGSSGICAVSVGAPQPLNQKCSGGKCDPDKAEDFIPPDLIPPYDGNTGRPGYNLTPPIVPVV